MKRLFIWDKINKFGLLMDYGSDGLYNTETYTISDDMDCPKKATVL